VFENDICVGSIVDAFVCWNQKTVLENLLGGILMKLYKKVNLLEDTKVIIGVNIASFLLMFGFALLFSFIAFQLISIMNGNNSSGQFNLLYIVLLFVSYFALIVIHELIHGMFFKIFAPEGKVSFGFKGGMVYAASIGNYYEKWKYAIIILAPFVVITLGLTILFYFQIINVVTYILLASIHAAGCAGDFYYIILVLFAPKNAVVEDTDVGMSIYLKNEK